MPSTQVRSEPFFNLHPDVAKYIRAIAMVKVTRPASKAGVEFSHHLIKRYRTSTPVCHRFDSILESLDRPLRRFNMGVDFSTLATLTELDRNPLRRSAQSPA